MIENCLFFIHAASLLLFGIFLSCGFAGIATNSPRNWRKFLLIFAICGALQVISYISFDLSAVQKLYPLTTHIPLILFLCLAYGKRPVTSAVSVFTAYLFCQPSNWAGLLSFSIFPDKTLEYLVRIICLFVVAAVTLKFFAPYIADIYSQTTRNVCIFGMVPFIYYLFDYATTIYTHLWAHNTLLVAEFLPFFLGIIYMVFAIVFCHENKEKMIAERNAAIVQITSTQQVKEIEFMKQREKEIRILRHDMRLFLNSLAACIEHGETDTARQMLSSYTSRIEHTQLQQFCSVDVLNYVLSDFADKCVSHHIDFLHEIEIKEFKTDITLFATILSNALDNAFNAQKKVPESMRNIHLHLKTSNEKILLSVENPFSEKPIFQDGLPVSSKEGHGYGSQSIRYMTELLGGHCQFSVKNNLFITQVIISEA